MFSTEIKEGTKKSHNAAENTKFVSSFLKGCVDPEEYRKLLVNFYHVYSNMEAEIRETNDPYASTLKQWCVKLNRSSFLERDLRYFFGPMFRDNLEPSEAAKTYVHRIREVSDNDPYLLIAHHYTRYIGDLSGGQILRGIAKKALNPPEGEGLHFYDFPHIIDAKAFKTDYRAALDCLVLSEQQKNALITEAHYAFRFNMYIFDEIQGDTGKSVLKLLWNTIKGTAQTRPW